MIPTQQQAKALWSKYVVPDSKQTHLFFVASVSKFLAEQLLHANSALAINIPLVESAALLHDLDKGVEKLPGEQHPDAAVRILKKEGMEEVAQLIKNHPLHYINAPETAPKTWEEKILFLSDKMVKYDIITVDKRFDLWRNEKLKEKEREQLELAYPKVKELEKEIFTQAGLTDKDMTEFARTVYT